MIKMLNNTNVHARRNVPRYLYHLTSKDNYKSILKDGFLKTNLDDTKLDGVFMFDILNFVKRWCNSGAFIEGLDNKVSIAKGLFFYIVMKNPNIVLLKIPTKNLDLKNLRCRALVFNNKISEKHSNYGDLATNRKHYSRKKFPIEYIYEKNILINNIQKIGELSTMKFDFDDFDFAQNLDRINVFELLKSLFKNQPELKAINLGEKSSVPFQDIG